MRSNNTIFAVSWLAPFLLLVVGCVVHLDSIVVYNIYYVLSRYFLIFFWLDLLGKNAPLIHSWRVAHVTPRVFASRYFDIFFWSRHDDFLGIKKFANIPYAHDLIFRTKI